MYQNENIRNNTVNLYFDIETIPAEKNKSSIAIEHTLIKQSEYLDKKQGQEFGWDMGHFKTFISKANLG